MNLFLYRVASSDKGTFGVLVLDDEPLCTTCEDPWKDNKTGISCIPEGTYSAVRHNGAKYQNVWALKNVPNRDAILIHQGNTIEDTRGCILVGSGFGRYTNLPSITSSAIALDMLKKKLPANFTITIKDITKGVSNDVA